jgi:hypothetical protein
MARSAESRVCAGHNATESISDRLSFSVPLAQIGGAIAEAFNGSTSSCKAIVVSLRISLSTSCFDIGGMIVMLLMKSLNAK